MELIIRTAAIGFAILLLLQYYRKPLPVPDHLTGREFQYSKFLLAAFAFVLTFVAAFREGFVDTRVYKMLSEQVGTDYANAFNGTIPIDNGFAVFMVFLNRINPDPQFLIIVTAVITLLIDLYILTKYSYDPPLTLCLFLATSYLGSMNGIRQVMAASILSLAFVCILKRKPLPYLLLVFLLSTFHASILVMIPAYFIISGKRLNWGMRIFILAVVLSFLSPQTAYSLMGTILEDSAYADYLDNEQKMGLMRFLVALGPALLSLLYCRFSKDLPGEDTRMADVLVNMHIVSLGFTTLGLKMVYFARISMYFSFVMPLILPITIHRCFNPRSERVMRRLVVALYLFYFGYQVYSFNSYGYFYDFHLAF